jgi:predicted DNA-binding protein
MLGGVSVVKKTVKKIATKDADQYMLRLPPGLRDQVARRAAENGRSMNTEIIDAIEKHLRDADRVTKLWDLFEQHRENLEAIPHIWDAVEYLEDQMGRLTGDSTGPLTEWRYEKERAARPPITAEQVAQIRGIVKELDVDEARFVERLRVPSVEAIKDFSLAMGLLSQVREDRTRQSQKKSPPE